MPKQIIGYSISLFGMNLYKDFKRDPGAMQSRFKEWTFQLSEAIVCKRSIITVLKTCGCCWACFAVATACGCGHLCGIPSSATSTPVPEKDRELDLKELREMSMSISLHSGSSSGGGAMFGGVGMVEVVSARNAVISAKGGTVFAVTDDEVDHEAGHHSVTRTRSTSRAAKEKVHDSSEDMSRDKLLEAWDRDNGRDVDEEAAATEALLSRDREMDKLLLSADRELDRRLSTDKDRDVKLIDRHHLHPSSEHTNGLGHQGATNGVSSSQPAQAQSGKSFFSSVLQQIGLVNGRAS
jgi:hypothetical protein